MQEILKISGSITKQFIVLFIVLWSTHNNAQIGIGTNSPEISSVLDVSSTTKGILIPRMTQVQRIAITAPATGLLVYQTNAPTGFYYYNGSAWKTLGGTGWELIGNSGTNSALDKLGTSDVQDFVVKTDNTEALRISSTGNVGLNTIAPSTKLHIAAENGAVIAFLDQDFESVSTGNVSTVTTNDPHYIDNNVSCGVSDGWRIVTSSPFYVPHTLFSVNRAIIDYGASSCDQDATLVLDVGVVTTAAVNIAFDYNFNQLDADDRFSVVLHNESQVLPDISILGPLSVDSGEASFSQQFSGIIPGDSYTLQFIYIGDYGFGVSGLVVS